MRNDTIIEKMGLWSHKEIDKALDKARADERAKMLDEVKMKFLEIAKELAEKGQILSDEQYYSLMDVVNLD